MGREVGTGWAGAVMKIKGSDTLKGPARRAAHPYQIIEHGDGQTRKMNTKAAKSTRKRRIT